MPVTCFVRPVRIRGVAACHSSRTGMRFGRRGKGLNTTVLCLIQVITLKTYPFSGILTWQISGSLRCRQIFEVVVSIFFYVHPDPWGNDPIWLHPGKLTWITKMMVSKRWLLLNMAIFGIYVKFRFFNIFQMGWNHHTVEGGAQVALAPSCRRIGCISGPKNIGWNDISLASKHLLPPGSPKSRWFQENTRENAWTFQLQSRTRIHWILERIRLFCLFCSFLCVDSCCFPTHLFVLRKALGETRGGSVCWATSIWRFRGCWKYQMLRWYPLTVTGKSTPLKN